MDLSVAANLAQLISLGPILATMALFYYRHQCHESRCLRPIWHTHPIHGHPVCKKHFRNPTDRLMGDSPR